jgi:hypothetical protein
VCHFWRTLYDFMEEVFVFLVGVWRLISWVGRFFLLTSRFSRGITA